MQSFFVLLQLTNSSVPLGAYNYSDGLEFLVESELITSAEGIQDWLTTELKHGSIRMDIAVMLKVNQAIIANENSELNYWNSWLNGTRETSELRQQSMQMGNSLLKLLGDLDPEKRVQIQALRESIGKNCHFAVAFGVAIALWEIDTRQAVWAYLHSWASNLVSAAVKLVPLGQTQGQQIIYELHPIIDAVATELLDPKEEHFYACSWGLGLASMNHETQYTRLFRS
ncbi:urease accessory protein UreF [[Limnothrix rosea] IAM M-220]|uniref:urease accessory protein UreF n=1 Tax=[Limnothrix rosea] IAM M-220 TaxID=454133 RepID=UPI000968DF33|nr:urease accessory protein UreF [[Limnothrix rosea] IAM M-220]OKH18571.1 urease accessory protein UreF [[Limnothrix rosea] IAM M-220]